MRKLLNKRTLKNLLRLGMLAATAGALSACVVDPGYGYYGPTYYGPSVYYEPAPAYYYGGYYHRYYYGGGAGIYYHHWH